MVLRSIEECLHKYLQTFVWIVVSAVIIRWHSVMMFFIPIIVARSNFILPFMRPAIVKFSISDCKKNLLANDRTILAASFLALGDGTRICEEYPCMEYDCAWQVIEDVRFVLEMEIWQPVCQS